MGGAQGISRLKPEVTSQIHKSPINDQPTLPVPKARLFINIEGRSCGAVSTFGYGFKVFFQRPESSAVLLFH